MQTEQRGVCEVLADQSKPDINIYPINSTSLLARTAEFQFHEEPHLRPRLRYPISARLNLAILILACIDIIASICLGAGIIFYYENLNSIQQDIFSESKLRTTDKTEHRRKAYYYGVGFSLIAVILSPSAVFSFGRPSKPCSFIWIFRVRALLWISLVMSMVVTLSTIIVTFLDNYNEPKQFLVLLIVPILLLRLVLWGCYVLYGWKCDYKDPRNTFWPYSNDQSYTKD